MSTTVESAFEGMAGGPHRLLHGDVAHKAVKGTVCRLAAAEKVGQGLPVAAIPDEGGSVRRAGAVPTQHPLQGGQQEGKDDEKCFLSHRFIA